MLLYRLSLLLYRLILFLASPFHEKAKKMRQGRKNIFEELLKFRRENPAEKLFWIHCASLGEFEQGRPILEDWKKKHPEYCILLTFFSPSGYEVRKNYPEADGVFYLPFDSKKNANTFIEIIQPSVVVFVKYEFWTYYFLALAAHNIPIFSISSLFRSDQHFFKPWGGAGRKALKAVTHFFVQDETSKKLLEKIQLQNVSITGDTRFDRVYQLCMQAESFPKVEAFLGQQSSPVLVIGSAWIADLKELVPALSRLPQLPCLLLAPHEIGEENVKRMEKITGNFNPVRYSQWEKDNSFKSQCLIIDNIGMLARLYAYADVCYVGGAFGSGLHNTLEAATWGKPVLFGPKFHKFREACELVDCQGAFSAKDSEGLFQKLSFLLYDENTKKYHGQQAQNYVQQGWGASEKITQKIAEILPQKR